jgi:uncharacterized protein (DUF1697 family)
VFTSDERDLQRLAERLENAFERKFASIRT